MNKHLVAVLISGISAIALGGASVGLYYGTKASAPVSSDSGEQPGGSTSQGHVEPVVADMFAADAPVNSEDILDSVINDPTNGKTNAKYINKAYTVDLGDGTKGFYYDLTSKAGYEGKVQFAIGIKSGAVAYYQFIANKGEDTKGVNYAKETTDFIGYNGSSFTATVVTSASSEVLESTPGAMKKAVDVAIADMKTRL